ncbi:MAG: PspC domain-containing protein [Pseudonocardia sp.]
MYRTDVQDTLREMWETRPTRPHEDRQVAGVAVAIARRYDVDPVLVRIGFVVAAFTGVGAALYIAGWMLLPEEPADPAAPVRRRSATGIAVLVGLAIATAGTFWSVISGDRNLILPALVATALLFLLHRSRGDRGSRAVETPAEQATSATPTGPSLTKEPASEEPAGPPAWDPLGAAPFAWDLPEPAPTPPAQPPRRRLPVTPVTLGLALLAGAVTTVVLLLAGALSLANLPLLLGVVLAVVGTGLVVSAFVRSGRGLIPIALMLSALTWAVVAAPLESWQGGGFGEVRVAPTTVAALAPSYQRTAGAIELDLRNLDLSVPGSGDAAPVRTSVAVGAGDVQVTVPRDADLTLTTAVGFGQAAYDDQVQSGPNSEIRVIDDLGADGVRSGRLLVLDIEAGTGNVEVHRG